jgi:porin
MTTEKKYCLSFILVVSALLICTSAGHATEITDMFSIGGVLAGAYQHQDVDNVANPDDSIGRGAVPFQVELSYTPGDKDEIFAKFGFAAGNGLNEIGTFNLAPWAADLEGDVKNINGRDRDYLLEAWYKHTFELGDNNSLGVGGGIIDSTGFLDENAFSNDEYTQFMNQALVNGPNVFLPSYDIGGAVEWEYGQFSFKGVVMDVGRHDAATGENNYNFYGGQIGYRAQSEMGEGNYRLIVSGTSEDFLNPTETERKARVGGVISIDQELSRTFGVWLRLGWQDDAAQITYDAIYSGGIQINGNWCGRDNDTIGLGFAQLPGSDQTTNDIDKTQVAEIYWRFALNDVFCLTADVQYMKDNYKPTAVTKGPDGFIVGLRGTVEF